MNNVQALIVFLTFVLVQPVFAQNWTPIGPEGGDFNFTNTDPNNGNNVVAFRKDSVYRTTNGGQSWTLIGKVPSAYLTEWASFDYQRIYISQWYGCYFTKDGGVSWSYGAFPSGAGYGTGICVHPTNPDIVYACGYNPSGGASKITFMSSADGGLTWQLKTIKTYPSNQSGQASTITISKSNPSLLFIGGISHGAATGVLLLRSDDGGVTWSEVSQNVDNDPEKSIQTIQVDPNDANNVYAGYQSFYKSTDSGLTWTKDSSEAFNIRGIGVDPSNGSNLYLCGAGDMFVSRDYGNTWIPHYGVLIGQGAYVEVSDASPSIIYVSSRYGIHKSIDSGSSWKPAHNGINAASITGLTMAPSQPEIILASIFGVYKVFKSDNGGIDFSTMNNPEENKSIRKFYINSMDPDIVMAFELGGPLHRSEDGCSTWEKVSFNGFKRDAVEDPSDPNTIYVACTESLGGQYQMNIHKSTDGGKTWPYVYPVGPPLPYASAYSVAMSKNNPSVLYVGGWVDDGSSNYHSIIYRSKDKGANWMDVTGDLDVLTGPYTYVISLWVSDENPDLVVAGTSNGVFRSSIGGMTWSPTNLGSYFWTGQILQHPATKTLYLTSLSSGVYKSDDEGLSWTDLNYNIPQMRAYSIALDAKNGWLYSGSSTDGVCALKQPPSPLWIQYEHISELDGGKINVSLDAGISKAKQNYLIFGSISGASPGVKLPGSSLVLPINWDSFTNIVIAYANLPFFQNFMGTLDGSGRSNAILDLPPIPGFAGTKLYFAYGLVDPFGNWDYVSNGVCVTVFN